MLFEFGVFWRVIVFLVVTWICYALWGFEFVALTLLALIASILKER